MDMINPQDFSKIIQMKKNHLLLLSFLCFSFLNLHSQNLKLAKHYFNNASYLEASEEFLKIEKKDQEILESLGDCFYYSSDIENAKQWYEKLINEYQETVSIVYFFRYAQVLYGVNETKEGNKWLKKYEDAKNIIREDAITIAENYKRLQIPNDKLQLFRLSTNTDTSEFGGAFLNDSTFVFSAPAGQGLEYSWNKENYLDLYQANIDKNGYLEDIKPLSDVLNSKWHEGNAIFTKDGNTVYFTSNNRIGEKKILGKDKISYLNIYKATKTNGVWGNIIALPFNVKDHITEHPALNEDETKLFFASDRPGTLGSLDLYVVDIFDDGTYGKPINLGTKINTDKREQFPFVNKDTLYFASDGHLTLGGLDIYKSQIKNNKYSQPENLKIGINSPLDDFAYVVNDSLKIGYISSNRDGSDDIFLFEMVPDECLLPVEVRDKKTNELIKNVTIKLFVDGKEVEEITSHDGKATFITDCDTKKEYKIYASHELHQPRNVILTKEQILGDETAIIILDSYVEIEEQIVDKNNKIQIDHEPILFDLNSSYLTTEATVILDDVVRVLNKYPEIVIRCESHTDSRATNKYNQWLSDRRAKRTAEYIIASGISASRITKVGFGEEQILNGCTDNVTCTEEQHDINRRTEFVLIAKPK